MSEAKMRRSRSILTAGQVRLFLALLVLGIVMLATSGFLYSTHPEGESLPVFYQLILIAHIVGGLLVLVPMVWFVLWHLKRARKTRNRGAVWTGTALTTLALVLAATGLTIMTQANSERYRILFRTHQIGAILLPLLFVGHRALSRNRPRLARLASGLGALALLFGGLVLVSAATRPSAGEYRPAASVPAMGPQASPGDDPFLPFRPATAVDESSPFFPSPVTTVSGGRSPARAVTRGEVEGRERFAPDMARYGFAKDQTVGAKFCAECHPDTVRQWEESAHRHSSMNNPFYVVSITDLRKEHGPEKSQWCGACHDPALIFPGSLLADGIDRTRPEAQAGITCLSCHAMERIHNLSGNGNYRLDDGATSPYLHDGAEGAVAAYVNRRLMKAKPEVHKRRMLKPFFRTSEYCATCHKVALEPRVNDYRFLRGQNEYDAWHDSGVSRNNPRTFYLPETARSCQDCHMPREPAPLGDVSAKGGTVRSHRFHAVNTALPALRGDRETVRRIEEFLKDRKLRVDVYAVSRPDGGATVLDEEDPGLAPGETVVFEVVVRNLGVGHTFPGGTNDSNEGWIDFRVADERGREVYRSGGLGPDGEVGPDAHAYRAVFVDEDGRRANRRNPQDFRTLVYARVIGPGTADVVRYQVRLPEERGRLNVTATLRWRKFNRELTRYVFRELGRSAPTLPITDVATDEVVLPVGGDGSRSPDRRPPDWTRVNDHGIAMLLQGDLKRAAASFRRVAELVPDRPDGPRNVARVLLREGDVPGALAELGKARELAPGDARTAFFFGRAFLKSGRYELAEKAFRVCLDSFPSDRGTIKAVGRLRFLQGDFEGSLAWFLRALEIDPEDVDAHFHRMKCYQGLGRGADAAEARKAYLMYKVDDRAAKVAKRYLLENEAMNRESQKIHVHR